MKQVYILQLRNENPSVFVSFEAARTALNYFLPENPSINQEGDKVIVYNPPHGLFATILPYNVHS